MYASHLQQKASAKKLFIAELRSGAVHYPVGCLFDNNKLPVKSVPATVIFAGF